MNRGILIVLAIILVAAGLAGTSALFTVSETEQALVVRFGDPRRAVTEPGLKFKVPFVDDVIFLEKRILDFDAPPEEIITSDKKRLVVDAYARFKISDPLKFYQAVNNEARARSRLGNIVNSNLRKTLGTAEFLAVLSGERAKLMREIRDSVNKEAANLGLEVVDVRIKRADLPQANSQAVFRRMQAEREREAKEYRAQGDEQSQKIRADADRQRTVLLAEARKKAETLRGEGDAVRNRVFADAYRSDPEFFAFYRSLQAYARSMTSKDTTLVLSPDSEFFRYFTNQFGVSKKGVGTTGKKSE
jgi:membrane protease subunit HflC